MAAVDQHRFASHDMRDYADMAHWIPAVLGRCGRKTREWSLQARAMAIRAGRRAKTWRPRRHYVLRVVSARRFPLLPWATPSAASSQVLMPGPRWQDRSAGRACPKDDDLDLDPGMLILDAEVLWLSWVEEKLSPVHIEVASK